jgi:hypothetical protein
MTDEGDQLHKPFESWFLADQSGNSIVNSSISIEAVTNSHPSFADANDIFSRKREKGV